MPTTKKWDITVTLSIEAPAAPMHQTVEQIHEAVRQMFQGSLLSAAVAIDETNGDSNGDIGSTMP